MAYRHESKLVRTPPASSSPEGASAIIAAYNAERYIREAIDSVLAQTRPVHELIVVDDGSTDNTGKILESYGSTLLSVRVENGGQARALNIGASMAKGNTLAFLDADDRWSPKKLENQAEVLASHPHLEAVFGRVRQFCDPSFNGVPRHEVMDALVPGGMLIRRNSFERIGKFREDLPVGGNIEWFSRAQDARLEYSILHDIVLERRIHSDNLGTGSGARKGGYFDAIRAIRARRRTACQRELEEG